MNQNKIKVAVVDDDESFACALERHFRASSFEVHTYPSAEAFLAPTTLPEPDCLVLDIHLGGMSGVDLLRRLRELGVPVPVIFVTAHDLPTVREEAKHEACSAYFSKPVSSHLSVEAITRVVGRTIQKP
jgi:FixJ family two-component response regulator